MKAGRKDLIGYEKKCLIRPKGKQVFEKDLKIDPKSRKSRNNRVGKKVRDRKRK